MSLPEFEPQFDQDFRNLAGFQEAHEVMAPLVPNPGRALYRAWDGEPIGYSSDCDPLTAEPYLSGLLMPDFLEDNRIMWGETFAMALVAGVHGYQQYKNPLAGALWALAGYLMPLPAAGAVAFQTAQELDLLPQWG